MKIKNITDKGFEKYGKVLKNYNLEELFNVMEETSITEGVIYEPSFSKLESINLFNELKERHFGGLDIQIGYCNGNNYSLNAVEYHRSSEVNIAVTDFIILLGLQQDIDENYSYDTSKIEAFLVPQGTAIECYATSLHYAPCNANASGFKCVVVLPKNTNLPLIKAIDKEGEDKLLFAKNKWLIGHPESNLADEGAFIGLVGDNITLK